MKHHKSRGFADCNLAAAAVLVHWPDVGTQLYPEGLSLNRDVLMAHAP